MQKPKIDTTDGNIFCLLGKARYALKQRGWDYENMTLRVLDAESYIEALSILSEYVELIPTEPKPSCMSKNWAWEK